MAKKTLILIVGPTAIGKTELSIHLATEFKSPVISVDSRQFFREMNIGTAKPSAEELKKTTHYFINNKSIHDEYNVGMFETECIYLLEQLFKKHDVIIAAGGSGLYINTICQGFDDLPQGDAETRSHLKTLFKEKGLSHLQELLKKHDPVYYNEVDINNPQRMMRAIEVCLAANTPYSTLRKNKKVERNFNIIKIGLNIERNLLYEKINLRVNDMIAQGLAKETRELHPFKHLNPLQTVGYKEFFEYFENKLTLEQCIEKIKQNTRNFAKRQLTWFKKDTDITWFNPSEKEKILTHITNNLSHA